MIKNNNINDTQLISRNYGLINKIVSSSATLCGRLCCKSIYICLLLKNNLIIKTVIYNRYCVKQFLVSAVNAWPNNKKVFFIYNIFTFTQISEQFSVPQIEYPLGGSSKISSHVYFLLIIAMVLLLWHPVTMVASEYHFWENNSITQKTWNRKYTWLPFLLLPPSVYSIWGTKNESNKYSSYIGISWC